MTGTLDQLKWESLIKRRKDLTDAASIPTIDLVAPNMVPGINHPCHFKPFALGLVFTSPPDNKRL